MDFPRCRIYREFIQTLMKDRSIRTNGGSCLFYFLILCSYANYSSSYRNIEHLTYKVVPGEWICSLKELQIHFRQKFQHQVISILDTLVEQNLLTYSLHEKNKIIQYKIKDWPKDNTALSYNYPSVQGSDAGPVVYFRNQTGNPLFNYQELARRWKQSKSSVSRLLKKLEDTDMITLISYSGKHGNMVYLRNYLSVMFNISDVMIDKEEIAMKMQLPIHIPKDTLPVKNNSECVSESITDEQIIVSQEGSCVPESHIKAIVRKVAEILEIQGISCCRCPKTKYILSPLSACKDSIYLYSLRIICPWGKAAYQFELTKTGKSRHHQRPRAYSASTAYLTCLRWKPRSSVERGGCIMSKKNHHPVSAEVENNPLYHDTYKLLRCYRDSTYSLMVAVRRVGKARSQYLLPDVLSKEAGCY